MYRRLEQCDYKLYLPPLEREQGRGLRMTLADQRPWAHPHSHYRSQPEEININSMIIHSMNQCIHRKV